MTTQTAAPRNTYPLTWTTEEIKELEQKTETASTPGLTAELLLTHDWTRAPAALCLELHGAQVLAARVNDGEYDLESCGLDKLKTTAAALLKAAQRRGLDVYDPPLVIQFQGFSVSL
jgi:hypothetical protein